MLRAISRSDILAPGSLKKSEIPLVSVVINESVYFDKNYRPSCIGTVKAAKNKMGEKK